MDSTNQLFRPRPQLSRLHFPRASAGPTDDAGMEAEKGVNVMKNAAMTVPLSIASVPNQNSHVVAFSRQP